MRKITLRGIIGETTLLRSLITDYHKEQIVKEVFELIGKHLDEGDTVVIQNFGKFEIKVSAARKGRNLKTGETCEIPERRKVKFSPAIKLVEKVK